MTFVRSGFLIGNRIITYSSSSNQLSRSLLSVGYLARYHYSLTPLVYRNSRVVKQNEFLPVSNYTRCLTTRGGKDNDEKPLPDCCKKEEPQLGLIGRFKKMYKEYWYVLVPVHLVTSSVWLGSFYYASKSGVDIVLLLNSLGFSETVTNPLKDSSMGHIAVAYLLYKIATPARYTVTLGGTTISIKYLSKWGYIKPMPTKEEFFEMYNIKRDNLQEKIADTKLEIKEKIADKKLEIKEKIADTKLEIQEKIADKKLELREKKTQLEQKKQNIIKTITKKNEAVQK